jgi:type I restriction enzyme S subunit
MSNLFQNTAIGNLPTDWQVGRVDSYFDIQQGKQVSKNNRVGENQRPFLRTANVFWGRLDLNELDFMHFSENEEKKFALHEGDLLLCEGGAVGRTAIWRNDVERCYYQNHLHRLRKKTDNTKERFSLYWFQYAFDLANVYFGQANTTTIPNLSKSRLSELLMPAPSFNEQQKIAYVLSVLQKAIELQDKAIQTTTELKNALMQKLFTEGLRGEKQKETEIGMIPESWEVGTINDFGKCITGTTPKTAIDKYYSPPQFQFIAPADLGQTKYVLETEKRIAQAGLDVSRKLDKNAVLCVCIGSSIGKVGMTYEPLSSTNQQINAIEVNKSFIPDFVYYLLNYYSDYWKSFSTFGPVPILSKGKFIEIPIPFTKDIEEQKNISGILLVLDNKIETTKRVKDKFLTLFQAILSELMTGQTRVHHLEFNNINQYV